MDGVIWKYFAGSCHAAFGRFSSFHAAKVLFACIQTESNPDQIWGLRQIGLWSPRALEALEVLEPPRTLGRSTQEVLRASLPWLLVGRPAIYQFKMLPCNICSNICSKSFKMPPWTKTYLVSVGYHLLDAQQILGIWIFDVPLRFRYWRNTVVHFWWSCIWI